MCRAGTPGSQLGWTSCCWRGECWRELGVWRVFLLILLCLLYLRSLVGCYSSSPAHKCKKATCYCLWVACSEKPVHRCTQFLQLGFCRIQSCNIWILNQISWPFFFFLGGWGCRWVVLFTMEVSLEVLESRNAGRWLLELPSLHSSESEKLGSNTSRGIYWMSRNLLNWILWQIH